MDTITRAGLVFMIRQAKSEYFSTGYKATDAEALGIMLSKYFQFDGVAILRTAEAALEDANFHTESGIVSDLADKYDPPFDPNALIDTATRSALFASLAEVYPGISKDRPRRLAKLNLLAGRAKDNPITSLSDRYCDMTMGDARRVFDMLNEIREAVS